MNELVSRFEEKKREDAASHVFREEAAQGRYKIAEALAKILDEGFRARGTVDVKVQCELDDVQLTRAQDWMIISCTDQDHFMTECAVEPDSLAAVLGKRSHLEPLRNREQMLDDVILRVRMR